MNEKVWCSEILNGHQRRTTHLETLENLLYRWLIFLFDLWVCFLGSSLSSPQYPLAHFSNTWMSLYLKESEAFYIYSVPADVFFIFVSLCELLPKMSNPLQACLQYPSSLMTVSLPATVLHPSAVFGHNHQPSGFVNEHYSLICKQRWLWTAQNRWALNAHSREETRIFKQMYSCWQNDWSLESRI